MLNDPSSPLAQRLVNAFVTVDSTEQLIIFVAGTDHMLDFCQELLEQYDRDNHAPLPQEINALCRAQGVVPGILSAELRKVLLALNRFHDAGRDHYAVLGLSPDASREEVKQTFRSLSKRYHPDLTKESGDQTQQFMEIAGAYHAIMAALPVRRSEERGTWRAGKHLVPRPRPPRHKLFFLGIALMVCTLAGASIYLAGRYNQEMIISQLQPVGAAPKPSAGLKIIEEKSSIPLAMPSKETTAGVPQPGEERPTPPAGNEFKKVAGPSHPAPQGSEANTPHPALELALREEICTVEDTAIPSLAPTRPKQPKQQSTALPPRQDSRRKNLPATEKKSPAHPIPPDTRKAAMPTREEKKQSTPDSLRPTGGEEEIFALINRYSTLYTRKELSAFLALFSEHATENGRPLPDVTDQYRSLFAHTLAIDLKILNMDLQEQPDGFRAQGNFRSSYTYNDGRTRIHNGDISFFLVKDHGELKIKALEYAFLD